MGVAQGILAELSIYQWVKFVDTFFFFFLSIYLFIYFERERERERESRGGAERKGERESQAGSMLSAWSLTWGSIPQIVRSWPESWTESGMLNRLSHPDAPVDTLFWDLLWIQDGEGASLSMYGCLGFPQTGAWLHPLIGMSPTALWEVMCTCSRGRARFWRFGRGVCVCVCVCVCV